jgi:hypothetical protein
MLKMKVDPEMYMKTKGSTDTMTENYSGFCAWSTPFLQKWTEIQRAFWLNTHKSDDNWGEAGTKIGSSVHRSIDRARSSSWMAR